MNKKTLTAVIITIIAVLSITIGLTYAFFSATITGAESSSTISVSGGTLTLTVNGGSNIDVSNIIPRADAIATKTITITGTNTTDLAMPYTMVLLIDSNTFATGSMKYTLDSTNTSSNGKIIESIGTQTNITTGASSITLGSGNFMTGTDLVHTYVLKLYFPESGANQNAEQGKSISAHINITSSEAQIPTLLSAKILGAGNVNVTTVLTTPGRAISTNGEAVLASTTDDYGTSYYFRGAVENNYIVFANMCWRVVRVTGNGAIKLVLYNFNPNSVVNPCDISQDGTSNAYARFSGETYLTAYNSNRSHNAHIGFMYGTPGSIAYADEHANINKSTILTNLETWYTNKLSSYANQLADTIWCNDKSIDTVYPYDGQLGYGISFTHYSARGRIYADNTFESNASPTLICPNDSIGGKLSKLTVSDTLYGNGSLTYKIGLLTVDEVVFAGGIYNTANSTYYLNKNSAANAWYSLSPFLFSGSGGFPFIWFINPDGDLNYTRSYGSCGLRPAISLISTTSVIGLGSSSNPFVVVE